MAAHLSGAFDKQYFDETLKIGTAHQRIGLEPRWYIGGYQIVLNELHGIILQNSRWNMKTAAARIEAITKGLMLDLDLALSTYQDILLDDKKNLGDQTESAIMSFQGIVFGVLDNVRENGDGEKRCRRSWQCGCQRIAKLRHGRVRCA